MGKLAEIKTKQTEESVDKFLKKVENEQKQKDCYTILKLMEKATREKPKLWGASIIGFGKLIYKSPATDREVEWFRIGFSPRKANITLYLMDMKSQADALKKLGKHKIGGGCLYINKLQDVDLKVLGGMINSAAKRK